MTAGDTQFFELVIGAAASIVEVKLVLMEISGNPDLYASFTELYPSPSGYQWSSTDSDGDVVVIRPAEVSSSCAAEPDSCTLYIGVHAPMTNSTFILTGSIIEYGAGFIVDSPAAIAGPKSHQPALFGGMLPAEGRSTCVTVATPANACSSLTNAEAISGCIALIDRGPFDSKCPCECCVVRTTAIAASAATHCA